VDELSEGDDKGLIALVIVGRAEDDDGEDRPASSAWVPGAS
jgi:hypothetical protein